MQCKGLFGVGKDWIGIRRVLSVVGGVGKELEGIGKDWVVHVGRDCMKEEMKVV